MKINLKKLSLTNFKGIVSFEANFNHVTNIFGQNGIGKSTLFDAFLWLFFGKNSEDVSKFEIKRLDSKNAFIPGIEAEVKALFHIDGEEIEAKKVLKQKWVKRRGSTETDYSGDENIYYWNDVPMKESEFKSKVAAIVDESLFKLITNPLYFNSIKWNERRNLLMSMAGTISDSEIVHNIAGKIGIRWKNELLTAISQKKDKDFFKEFRAEIAAKKKKVKDDAENIPSRIDEVNRSMPEAKNFETIKGEVVKLQAEIDAIQNLMNDDTAKQGEESKKRTEAIKEHNDKVQKHQQTIFDFKTRIQNIEFEAKQFARDQSGTLINNIDSTTRLLNEKKAELERLKSRIQNVNNQVQAESIKVDAKRDEYIALDEKVFHYDESTNACPTCKQSLPSDELENKIETLRSNFNNKKLEDLQSIKKAGEDLKTNIAALNKDVEETYASVSVLSDEIVKIECDLAELKLESEKAKTPDQHKADFLTSHGEHNTIKNELVIAEKVEFIMPVFEPLPVNQELIDKRDKINSEIFNLQKSLADEETINKANLRIKELRDQESKLAQELAELEGSEYAVQQFTKAKVEAIEANVNGKFKQVNFKMFRQQVNGGEEECCDTLINGVPFSDANNAARINAGVDIINTLCEHFNVFAPIFIDNRESVTNLIESNSQIVNLIVSDQDKQLRVA